MHRVRSVVLTFMVAVLAGCVEGPNAGIASDEASWTPDQTVLAGPAQVTVDEAGDASVWRGETVYGAAAYAGFCGVRGTGPSTICGSARNLPLRDTLGVIPGEPAEPELDILGLTITESADIIRFDIELSAYRSPQHYLGQSPGDATTVAWEVYWETEDGRDGDAYLDQTIMPDGSIQERAEIATYCADLPNCTTGCNDWWYCAAHIETSFEAGSPGRLRLHVPREAATGFDNGSAITFIGAYSHAMMRSEKYDTPLPRVVVQTATGHVAKPAWTYSSEIADAAIAVRGYSPTPATSTPDWPTSMAWPRGDAGDPAADIIGTHWNTTPTGLQMRVELAKVADIPNDEFYFHTEIGMPSGRMQYAWITPEEGSYVPYAARADGDGQHEMNITMSVEPGSPGTITLSIPSSEMEPFATGDQITIWYVQANALSPRYSLGDAGSAEFDGEAAARHDSVVTPRYYL